MDSANLQTWAYYLLMMWLEDFLIFNVKCINSYKNTLTEPKEPPWTLFPMILIARLHNVVVYTFVWLVQDPCSISERHTNPFGVPSGSAFDTKICQINAVEHCYDLLWIREQLKVAFNLYITIRRLRLISRCVVWMTADNGGISGCRSVCPVMKKQQIIDQYQCKMVTLVEIFSSPLMGLFTKSVILCLILGKYNSGHGVDAKSGTM